MDEEFEGQQPDLEVVEGGEPTAEPTGIDENERKTWEGRLRAEQDRLNTTRTALQQMGWDVDEHGNPYPTQQAQQPQTQYQQPAEQNDEEFEWTTQNLRQMIRQEAQQIAAQQVGGLLPVVDQTLTAVYEQKYNDFNEIKADTTNILRQMGYSSITHAQAVNAAAVQIAMDAARGRKAASTPAPPDPNIEAQRQARVAQAVTPGAGGTAQPTTGKTYGFSAEEVAQLAAMGLTPEQADRMLSDGVARVKVGGDK
ncbi:MAG: hypothetical protein KA354_24935 [Phycisphaerae bacterium]|nr:hypothetical protein [Phycisphaerae bacterium]